ncbi:hypothetical protein psal_cds_143 [Pandoravirus salinus]|uniref:Uncharacterized protein n=1 Tax=Pandoravirus salinus TaxID=1349410 RepID=S4VT33_9VIRU|nr:hypothetical protein psal_cds_143 [Pandoravirus salinus]AGO83609.1 hypothetical protein psal_cds_143 [Pandoravirus salinus]
MADLTTPADPPVDHERAPRDARGIMLGDRFMCVCCTASMLAGGFWPPTARFAAVPVASVCSACGRCTFDAPGGDDGADKPDASRSDLSTDAPPLRAVASGDGEDPGGGGGGGGRPLAAPSRGYMCVFM